MKFSEKTISILKNYAMINPSIQFNEGSKMSTISQGKNILSETEVEEYFPKSVCIYDLSEFLNSLNLFDDYDIDFQDNYVIIKNGNNKLKYYYTDEEMIVVPPKKNSMDTVEFDDEITLQFSDIQKVLKAGNTLKLPDFAISSENGTIFIEAIDFKNDSGNNFKIEILENGNSNFTYIFKTEFISKLIETDVYKVSLHSKFARFVSDGFNNGLGIRYYIQANYNSKSKE